MVSYNPFGSNSVSQSIVSNLIQQTPSAFSMGERGLLESGDGRGGVRFDVSVGLGKGATKVSLGGNEVGGVLAALRGFDPNADVSSLTPGEIVARTIKIEGDDVTFKITLAKNARTVNVPVKEWPSFLEYMGNVSEWTSAAVDHFRSLVESESK
jgi:hypothetical protein